MPAAILAFDTTLEACSVALRDASEIICEQRCEPRAHARILLPMIDTVLARAAMRLQDLDAIAFAQGPGSFTGVRMAASVAQGLAFGAQLPVIPLSSLATLAQACIAKASDRLIVPIIDARMGEVYAGFYSVKQSLVVAQHADALLEPHAVAKFLANMFPDRTLHAVGNGWSLLDCTSLQIAQHNH
ncbi:MAG: tRNA (adenosine(37)-N6)-threonylcarbamoyltransferase complex dimerization subunit type 1 TsaB, partial [Pseudomonadales bacterium]